MVQMLMNIRAEQRQGETNMEEGQPSPKKAFVIL